MLLIRLEIVMWMFPEGFLMTLRDDVLEISVGRLPGVGCSVKVQCKVCHGAILLILPEDFPFVLICPFALLRVANESQ